MSGSTPFFMNDFKPTFLETDNTFSSSTHKKTISWRDQLKDPIYQFVVLVAGMCRHDVFNFIVDDSQRNDNSLQREDIIQQYTDKLNELNEQFKQRRGYLLLTCKDNPGANDLVYSFDKGAAAAARGGAAAAARGVEYLDRSSFHKEVVMKADEIDKPRTIFVQVGDQKIRKLVRERREEALKLQSDIQILEQRVEEETANDQTDDIVAVDDPLLNMYDRSRAEAQRNDRKRQTFFSNEIIFKPLFQAAVSSALDKVHGRISSNLRLDDLMKARKYKTLFARFVALQVLIFKSNNPRGEYEKTIDYRRLIATENGLIRRLRNISEGRLPQCHEFVPMLF